METWLQSLLTTLALPEYGSARYSWSRSISATLLPLGSEPAVFGLLKLNPDLFWPAILVATAGNTIGGAISWAMGYGAERAYEHFTHKHVEARALSGWSASAPRPACRLPIVGDPLCAVVAGCALPFWPCVLYMAIGKFARYLDDERAAVVVPGPALISRARAPCATRDRRAPARASSPPAPKAAPAGRAAPGGAAGCGGGRRAPCRSAPGPWRASLAAICGRCARSCSRVCR